MRYLFGAVTILLSFSYFL